MPSYKLTYTYDGIVPAGAPALPVQQTYETGAMITKATVPTLEGYDFHGWVGEPDTMPAHDVEASGHWIIAYRREIFTPKFKEFITLYRGVERVWVSGAPSIEPGDEDKDGILYAEMEDGTIQTLGPVSGYFYAQKQGFDGTFLEWVQVLLDATQNAMDAEGWARGTHNNIPVDPTDPAYNNNSKFYSEVSLEKSLVSEDWAEGTRGGTSDPTFASKSSKYWAEQSKSYTNGKDLNNQPVQARAEDNAEYFKDEAKGWANYGTQDVHPSSTNNAYYWNTQAIAAKTGAETAQGLAETAQAAAETAQSLAETAQQAAETAQGLAETAQGLSEDAQQAAETAQNLAETAQTASETAQGLSEAARDASVVAKTAAETAQSRAETAQSAAEIAQTASENFSHDSEAWAKGTRNGTDVPTTDETYRDNSKWWAQQSSASAASASTSATNASASEVNALSYKNAALNAQTAAETAQTNAEIAQAAAESARTSAQGAQTSAENARDMAESYKNLARDAQTAAANSASAAALSASGAETSAGSASLSASNASTSEQNALSYKNLAETAATNAASSEANASNSATSASLSASNASLSATNASQSASNASMSETNASSSAASAADSASDAQGYASDAADSAQTATEKAESIQNAQVSHSYQNSSSGTVPPTGIWSDTPYPTEGQYLWVKVELDWGGGNISTWYDVGYVGVNGTGSVDSVNGKGGRVVLYGTDVSVSESDSTTIAEKIISITNSQIDDLFT